MDFLRRKGFALDPKVKGLLYSVSILIMMPELATDFKKKKPQTRTLAASRKDATLEENGIT